VLRILHDDLRLTGSTSCQLQIAWAQLHALAHGAELAAEAGT
jgi:hypothetical protein